MNSVLITGSVNDQHLLSAQVPSTIPPGPVTIMIVPQDPSDANAVGWMSGVAREWADELGDQRQDIYTLNDGEPVDAS